MFGVSREVLLALAIGTFLAATGLVTVAMGVMSSPTPKVDWEAREQACIDDPACDLAKFDRARENAQTTEFEPAWLGLGCLLVGLLYAGFGVELHRVQRD